MTNKSNVKRATSKRDDDANALVMLTTLAEAHNVDPKQARAKARRLRSNAAFAKLIASDDNWMFRKRDVSAVEALIFAKRS